MIPFRAELKGSKEACTAGGEVTGVSLRVVTHTNTFCVSLGKLIIFFIPGLFGKKPPKNSLQG